LSFRNFVTKHRRELRFVFGTFHLQTQIPFRYSVEMTSGAKETVVIKIQKLKSSDLHWDNIPCIRKNQRTPFNIEFVFKERNTRGDRFAPIFISRITETMFVTPGMIIPVMSFYHKQLQKSSSGIRVISQLRAWYPRRNSRRYGYYLAPQWWDETERHETD
jgi:hypothetical protein